MQDAKTGQAVAAHAHRRGTWWPQDSGYFVLACGGPRSVHADVPAGVKLPPPVPDIREPGPRATGYPLAGYLGDIGDIRDQDQGLRVGGT